MKQIPTLRTFSDSTASNSAFACRSCRLRLSRNAVGSTRPPRYYSSDAKGSSSAPDFAKFVKKRIDELGGLEDLGKRFPRWTPSERLPHHAAGHINSLMDSKCEPRTNASTDYSQHITVYGRVKSRRKQGSNLYFLDVESCSGVAQIVLNWEEFKMKPGNSFDAFRQDSLELRRGDWISVRGYPYRSDSGQTSLIALESPRMESPSLQPLSLNISDAEFLNHNRHVARILDSTARDAIVMRSKIINAMRNHLLERHFVEVNTPLLTRGAGGAVARPFETKATEFSDLTLNLRIAPELFLKRLIVSNMDRVFEIGPAFRNEGIDLTHNPEFTMCEFYLIFASLDDLINMTECLFAAIRQAVTSNSTKYDDSDLGRQWLLTGDGSPRQISFVPALEAEIGKLVPEWVFPDLVDPDEALKSLKEVSEICRVPLPPSVSLPRLLDVLSGHFLEPLCKEATWIKYHPECMAPLAKSFDMELNQERTADGAQIAKSHLTDKFIQTLRRTVRVAARAELYVEGHELVNCYEEENSPVEQRRKFVEQLKCRDDLSSGSSNADDNDEPSCIDESYLSTLEWGMPPTGGVGIGVDRLIMLFANKKRIADVLPFGTLNNVVGLGTGGKQKAKKGE